MDETHDERRRLLTRLVQDESGTSIIYVLITMVVVLGLLGVVVDGGWQVQRRIQAQSGADSAALSALENISLNSTVTSETNPVGAAASLILSNWGLTGTVSSKLSTGLWQITSPVNATAPLTLTLNFCSAGGIQSDNLQCVNATDDATQTMTVTAHLTSSWNALFLNVGVGRPQVETAGKAAFARTTSAALYTLATTGTGLDVESGDKVKVTGSGIIINSSQTGTCQSSSASGAVHASSSSSITSTTSIGVVGEVCPTNDVGYSPAPTTITAGLDPFRAVPTPTLGLAATDLSSHFGSNSSVYSAPPGTYQDIALHNAQALTLAGPGNFIFTGTSTTPLSLGGTSTLTSTGGAMLFFTCGTATSTACASGQVGAGLTLNSGGALSITAPSTGNWTGMAIFYDRNNAAPLTVGGGGAYVLTGSLYAKSAALTFTGGGAGSLYQSRIVANTISLSGGGALSVSFNQSQNYTPLGNASISQ